LEEFNQLVTLKSCTLHKLCSRLPKAIFKAIEYIYILSAALRDLVLTHGKKHNILLITGWALLPLVPIGRIGFKKTYIWKFGIAEELLLNKSRKYRWYYLLVKSLEKLFFSFTQGFIVQTPGMADYAVELAGSKKQTVMVPCVADYPLFAFNAGRRETVRAELGVTDRFVVVNLGSFNPWQNADDVMRVFTAIHALRKNAILLLVTADGDRYVPYLRKHGIEAYRIRQVSHNDVPRLLWAADLGLLIRIDHPVITVASPIKYAEYLAAGLPVIMTRNVGVYSQFTARYHLGRIVDPRSAGLKTRIEPFLTALPLSVPDRLRISEFAAKNLSDRSVRHNLRGLGVG
jgi:glycosyltransferase involved in cell wall biosynthesis